jgi:hypothetical protein
MFSIIPQPPYKNTTAIPNERIESKSRRRGGGPTTNKSEKEKQRHQERGNKRKEIIDNETD